jgi:hypothetical protein
MSKAIVTAQALPEQTLVASAVAVVVPMIGDRPAIELQDTLFNIGEETFAAEGLMARGKAALDVLDANLHDIVKGLVYSEFLIVRDYFKGGIIDKGRTEDAAQKVWERSINRVVSTFDFVKPKSEAKDAVRKAEAKAKAVAAMAAFSDGDLEDQKADLLAKGDKKSVAQAGKVISEIERRNATELDAAKAARKAVVDKLSARIKELAKAGTEDADALLMNALLSLG